MTVIGAGSWGTALAIQCARAGHPTRLWGRDAGLIDAMRRARRNERYLPDAQWPPSLEPVADFVFQRPQSLLWNRRFSHFRTLLNEK